MSGLSDDEVQFYDELRDADMKAYEERNAGPPVTLPTQAPPERRPYLSIIIPSAGQRMAGLARLLDSIRLQGRDAEDVEVLVVGDTLDGPLLHLELWCSENGVRYVGHAGDEHCYGHPQRQEGIDHARGYWLWWMADDDIATLGSIAAIKSAIRAQPHRRPLFFRFLAPWRHTIWYDAPPYLDKDGKPLLVEGNIDASAIIVPNVPLRLGVWQNRYSGDFDFAAHTSALWDHDVGWIPEVVCIARPTTRDDWTRFNHRAREGQPVRLNLGCGAYHLPHADGWLNIDSNAAMAPDLVLDVVKHALPFEESAVTEIYSGHMLEHLERETVPAFLAECRRVLKPGGRLGLLVPDTREVMRRYIENEPAPMEYPAGVQRDFRNLDDMCAVMLYSTVQDSRHQWSYDLTTLRRVVWEAGFGVGDEIDRYHDPRLGSGQWYQCGSDFYKPQKVSIVISATDKASQLINAVESELASLTMEAARSA